MLVIINDAKPMLIITSIVMSSFNKFYKIIMIVISMIRVNDQL